MQVSCRNQQDIDDDALIDLHARLLKFRRADGSFSGRTARISTMRANGFARVENAILTGVSLGYYGCLSRVSIIAFNCEV